MFKILIVDDELSKDKGLGSQIYKMLQKESFDAIFAKTWQDNGFGVKAKDIMDKEDISLVLLDVMFPGQRYEGGEIFEFLKGKVPVIVLSVSDDFNIVRELFLRGAKDYILKPMIKDEPDKFISSIKSVLADPENSNFTLTIINKAGRYWMDILDINKESVLKRRRWLSSPIKEIIFECLENDDRTARFPERTQEGYIKELIPFEPSDVHKDVWKFNHRLINSSKNRINSILQGVGEYGTVGYKLNIGNVEVKE